MTMKGFNEAVYKVVFAVVVVQASVMTVITIHERLWAAIKPLMILWSIAGVTYLVLRWVKTWEVHDEQREERKEEER